MYVKIYICKMFEFYLYKNKVIKIHPYIMYVHLALIKKLMRCIASLQRYCNCSPNVCGSSIKD
jgi:hypothetical protein